MAIKNIKQIREQQEQNTVLNEEMTDERKLVSLIRAGLFDTSKLPLLKRAMSKDTTKITPQERKVLLDLLDSLMDQVLQSRQVYTKVRQNVMNTGHDLKENKESSETEPRAWNERPWIKSGRTNNYLTYDPRFGKATQNTPSQSKIPMVIILKRKALRAYPDNQMVALYYAQNIDQYFTVPFGGNVFGVNIREEGDEKENMIIEYGVTGGYIANSAIKFSHKDTYDQAKKKAGRQHDAEKFLRGHENTTQKFRDNYNEKKQPKERTGTLSQTDAIHNVGYAGAALAGGLAKAAGKLVRKATTGKWNKDDVVYKDKTGKTKSVSADKAHADSQRRRERYLNIVTKLASAATNPKNPDKPRKKITPAKIKEEVNVKEAFRRNLQTIDEGWKDVADTAADIAVPFYSASKNLAKGNYGRAAVDAAIDVGSIALTGGIGRAGIAAGVKGATKIGAKLLGRTATKAIGHGASRAAARAATKGAGRAAIKTGAKLGLGSAAKRAAKIAAVKGIMGSGSNNTAGGAGGGERSYAKTTPGLSSDDKLAGGKISSSNSTVSQQDPLSTSPVHRKQYYKNLGVKENFKNNLDIIDENWFTNLLKKGRKNFIRNIARERAMSSVRSTAGGAGGGERSYAKTKDSETSSDRLAGGKITKSKSTVSQEDPLSTSPVRRKQYYKTLGLKEQHDFMGDIQKIAKSRKKSHEINVFENVIKINNNTAKKVIKTFNALNEENKQKFTDMLNESPEGFKKAINFSIRY